MELPTNKYYCIDGFLRIREGSICYDIRTWPRPVARRRSRVDCRYVAGYIPEFKLVYPPPKYIRKTTAEKSQLSLGLEFDQSAVRKGIVVSSRQEVFQEVNRQLPYPYAKALSQYADLQWYPLLCLWKNKRFIDVMKSSPALAYLLANDRISQNQILRDSTNMLSKIVTAKQVELLPLLGLPASKRMLKILRKIPAAELRREVAFRLISVSQIEASQKMLGHMPAITYDMLQIAGEERILDHVTPGFMLGLIQERGQQQVRNLLSETIRLHQNIHGGDAGSFESVAQLVEVHEELLRIKAEKDAQVRIGPFPAPPLAGTEQIQPIKTYDALCEEGRLQHHCVSLYRSKIDEGGYYVYRMDDPERLTIGLSQVGGRWALDQLRGPCNQEPSEASLQLVKEWIEEAQPVMGRAGSLV